MTQPDEQTIATEEISKRYVFFLRHYNDIDNIAPIIHAFLHANRGHRAEVVLYEENYCGRGDPNLRLLSQAFPAQFRWSWIGDHFGLDFERSRRIAGWQQRLRSLVSCLAPLRRGSEPSRQSDGRNSEAQPARTMDRWRWLPGALRSVADVRSGNAGDARIRRTLAPLVTSPRPADLVIFDVVRCHHVRGYLRALRTLGCRSIICLPVSPLINYNVLREYDFKAPHSREFLNRHNYSGFDAISYTDDHYLNTYRVLTQSLGLIDGLPRKVARIGSLRYYPEWLRIRAAASASGNEPLPPPSRGGEESRKLLVLLSRLKTNVNRAELQACIDWLAQARGLEIRIKGHTRSGRGETSLQLHALQNANDQDTSALIDWSDAVMFWGTSAALEGYAKGKTMICIPFVSSNLNLYAHFQAGSIAHCRDEMVIILHEFARTGIPRTYNHAGIHALMRDVVQAGLTDWQEHIAFTLNYLQMNESNLSPPISEAT